MYDGDLLSIALQKAGFTNIRRCSFGKSDDVHFNGIESHGKKVGNNEMASFESMVFEAEC